MQHARRRRIGLPFARRPLMSPTDWRPEQISTLLDRDREATDRTLKAERQQADQLSAAAVAEEVNEKLAAVRAETDAQASRIDPPENLPEVVETLAEALTNFQTPPTDSPGRPRTHDVSEAGAIQTCTRSRAPLTR